MISTMNQKKLLQFSLTGQTNSAPSACTQFRTPSAHTPCGKFHAWAGMARGHIPPRPLFVSTWRAAVSSILKLGRPSFEAWLPG